MQTSKVFGAVFAVALGSGAVLALSHGLEAAQPSATATCKDVRLSMTDQNKCTTEVKSAVTDAARQQVIAQYQSKAAMRNNTTPIPSAMPAPQTTPGVDETLPSTGPQSSSSTPSPHAPATPQ
jgi:hypothetical protein